MDAGDTIIAMNDAISSLLHHRRRKQGGVVEATEAWP